MTTRSIFWRLFWKEYRLQRALWIAMTALAAMTMLLVFASFSKRDSPLYLFWIAGGLPAMYFLGCGASLFAGEREAGTYEYQRALPVGARRVFLAKIAFALASALLLFSLTSLLAFYLTGWTLHPPQGFSPLAVILAAGIFGLDMLLWATLFSLLSKRVLMAGVLGVAATSIHLELAGNLFHVLQGNYATLPSMVAVALAVMLTDCAWGFNWFREKQDRRSLSDEARLAAELPDRAVASFDRWQRAGRLTILGRFLWQHWRQSWRMTAVILAALIPLSIMSVEGFNAVVRWPEIGQLDRSIDPISYLVAFLILAFVPLLGTTAFMADQRRHGFRFLTDRGVPPKQVWLSRLLILFAIPAIAAAILLVVGLSGSIIIAEELRRFAFDSSEHIFPAAWNYMAAMNVAFVALGYVVLGLSAGQFCSMFFRSSLLAGLFGIVLTTILTAWCALMWFWGVPWLWSVVPIPLVLLLATRLRTRDWLLERNTFRSWFWPAMVMILPAAAILAAVPAYRVYTIPVVDPHISCEEFARAMTPEEKTTFDLYRRALTNTIPLKYDAFREQETIDLAMKASRGKYFNPAEKPLIQSRSPSESLISLGELLIDSAAKLEDAGKLDEAFERYAAAIRVAVHLRDWRRMPIFEHDYHHCFDHGAGQIEAAVYARLPGWAARPGQTPERIIAATRQLEQLTAGSSAIQGVKLAYCRMHSFLTAEPSEADGFGGIAPPVKMIWNRLPWERARALRMLNLKTQIQISVMDRAERQAQSGEQIVRMYERSERLRVPWSENADFPYALRWQIYVPPFFYDVHYEMVREFVNLETVRRATRLLLAVEAWKLRHGSLPKNLDALVGTCIDRMPIDPYSGRPFRYCRDGLKSKLVWSQPTTIPWKNTISGTLDAGVPFVWSAGANLEILSSNFHDTLIRDYIGNFTSSQIDGFRRPRTDDDVWQSGWPFPIP